MHLDIPTDPNEPLTAGYYAFVRPSGRIIGRGACKVQGYSLLKLMEVARGNRCNLQLSDKWIEEQNKPQEQPRENLIFGHTWEAIQTAQQGGGLRA